MTDKLMQFIIGGSGDRPDVSELSCMAEKAAIAYCNTGTPLREKLSELASSRGLTDNETTLLCQMANRKTGSLLTQLHGNKKGNIEFDLAVPVDVIARVSERPVARRAPATEMPYSTEKVASKSTVVKSRDRVIDDLDYFDLFGLREHDLTTVDELTADEKFSQDREAMADFRNIAVGIENAANEYNTLKEKVATEVGNLLLEGEHPQVVSIVLHKAGVPVETIRSIMDEHGDITDWSKEVVLPKYASIEVDTSTHLFTYANSMCEADRAVQNGVSAIHNAKLPHGLEPFSADLEGLKAYYTAG